jgi:BirA family biotin operon repressor/biotin-[acetyl-CoA-carboxylase] ligase
MFDINLYKKYLLNSNFGEIEYFTDLNSTNSKALELSKSNTPNGKIVVTDNQTAGRGRRDNKWSSAIGKSLTFSIILYPNCSIDQISQYSIIAGLAVSDTLSGLGLTPNLKWPNDILIKGKKICGILIESKLSSKSIKALVIGIGLNVNEELSDFTKDLQKISTSIKIDINQEQVREHILASIINNLNGRLNNIDEFISQIEEWEQRCDHMNSEVSFHNNNNTIVGVFKGLTEEGSAKIIINDKERIFNSGELERL